MPSKWTRVRGAGESRSVIPSRGESAKALEDLGRAINVDADAIGAYIERSALYRQRAIGGGQSKTPADHRLVPLDAAGLLPAGRRALGVGQTWRADALSTKPPAELSRRLANWPGFWRPIPTLPAATAARPSAMPCWHRSSVRKRRPRLRPGRLPGCWMFSRRPMPRPAASPRP